MRPEVVSGVMTAKSIHEKRRGFPGRAHCSRVATKGPLWSLVGRSLSRWLWLMIVFLGGQHLSAAPKKGVSPSATGGSEAESLNKQVLQLVAAGKYSEALPLAKK